MSPANNHPDLKDQQIRDLQARLKQAERGRDEALEALRPFAEMGRELAARGVKICVDIQHAYEDGKRLSVLVPMSQFARAAELVPATETKQPDAVKAPG